MCINKLYDALGKAALGNRYSDILQIWEPFIDSGASVFWWKNGNDILNT